jgi:hypothetical protein
MHLTRAGQNIATYGTQFRDQITYTGCDYIKAFRVRPIIISLQPWKKKIMTPRILKMMAELT